jgi:hypothetical protein
LLINIFFLPESIYEITRDFSTGRRRINVRVSRAW